MTSAPSAHTPRSHDHFHPPHASSRFSRTTPIPFSPSLRPPSAGRQAAMSPLRPHDGRSTPFPTQDARTPSPNYFALTVEPAKDYTSSGGGAHARSNWSPPTSNVRSTAAASPRIVPLDQNPDLEAFRRQTELNGFRRSSGFEMAPQGLSRAGSSSSKSSIPEPVMSASPRSSMLPPPTPTASSANVEQNSLEAKQRSPKRLLSSPSPHVADRPRRHSPAAFNNRDGRLDSQEAQFLSGNQDSRLSLPPTAGSPPPVRQQRAETLPAVLNGDTAGECKDAPVVVTPQHVVNLLESCNDSILLLDLRVSTQYARSRITGALNLCVPTTLLKRPSYNLQKLADMFADDEQKSKFERWRSCQYIIVYDANSTLLKDALSCANMLKKFVNEGWSGFQYVIRGGFQEFSKRFPGLVAHDSASGTTPGAQSTSAGTSIAPVVGGCPMPASSTKSAANPFFGNIRQNMDLIGGVGQMTLKIPTSMTQRRREQLPQWLRNAVEASDAGKLVADKFLQIEKREQKRMQDALSGKVHYGTPGSDGLTPSRGFQIAGLEKGAKNRYNNIWPYEHSRVRLEGVHEGGCDYINASHLQASWSNKRYIATQGPIPATFNDFWNVVWQQDVRVIVMLTAEKEGGQLKAHNYWSERHYGPLHLSFLSEHRASLEPARIQRHREGSRDSTASAARRRPTNPTPQLPAPQPEPENESENSSSEHPFVIVRRFALSHADMPFERIREITQLQYTNWPDFGAPAHPAHLLGLVEQCDAVVRASSHGGSPSTGQKPQRPMLVHCSAGCGRTGTFCTVDSVIDMMKRQQSARRASSPRRSGLTDSGPFSPLVSPRPGARDPAHSTDPAAQKNWLDRDDIDLIEKTVEEFRHQRLSAVQSLRQFVLCYESVLEWLAETSPEPA